MESRSEARGPPAEPDLQFTPVFLVAYQELASFCIFDKYRRAVAFSVSKGSATLRKAVALSHCEFLVSESWHRLALRTGVPITSINPRMGEAGWLRRLHAESKSGQIFVDGVTEETSFGVSQTR